MPTTHAFDFLAEPNFSSPVVVAFGDEPFLKRLVLQSLRDQVLGDDEDTPYATFEGKGTEWRDVVDEVSTVSLFGGGRPRLVIVEQADDFVSRNRSKLEDYFAAPASSGILVLEVGQWPSNTRLYKAIDKSGLQIACRPPLKGKSLDKRRLIKWLQEWGKSQHQASLAPRAAELLLDLEGPELGLLDQDLAKLALYTAKDGKVTEQMVRDVVGGWRAKTTWDLIDAAADGNSAEALLQLDRLLQSGEHPLALLGQIAWSLRRFAAATRIYQLAEAENRRIKLSDALQQAGFKAWPQGALENADRQLVQLGRERAGRLFQWLLEADLALKGSHSTPERSRFVLERLFLRLGKETKSMAEQAPATIR